jgi:hypothetical protein
MIEFYFIIESILPESPRWLVSKGRFDEAEKILRRITNKRNFDSDAFQTLKETQGKVRLMLTVFDDLCVHLVLECD